mgnify:CR=1 FL=1
MSKQFDVVVIGGGPGGYIAAIRAAQLGFQVACIDEWKNAAGGPAPGGTCTNVGCIPSKALLQSSEHFEHANHHFADHGITAKDVKMDVAKMIARKDNVVKQNNDGILYLFKKNKVTFFHGRGSFAGKAEGGYTINVAGKTEEAITAKQVIIATGSNARALPGTPFDEVNVLSNDGALRVGAVPKKLALIGSGVIGLEMGSVWRRLGADVTILEGLPTFLGAVDEQIAKEAKKAFDKQGLKIELGVKVGEIVNGKKGVTVNTVSPGYIGTDMVRAIKPEVLEKIVSGIPVKRLGTPEEIAALVAFLELSHSESPWSALAWAVVIGVVATVVAAVLPAARACRVPPIEARHPFLRGRDNLSAVSLAKFDLGQFAHAVFRFLQQIQQDLREVAFAGPLRDIDLHRAVPVWARRQHARLAQPDPQPRGRAGAGRARRGGYRCRAVRRVQHAAPLSGHGDRDPGGLGDRGLCL